jgi:hypothetical protein
MARERQVRILNPGHGAPFTSPKRAIKYVVERRARIVGEFAIEFIDGSLPHLAVLARIAGQIDTSAPAAPAKPHNSPTIDEIRDRQPITDSGFGFARYPLFPESAFRSRPVYHRRAHVFEFPRPLRKAA